MRYFSIILSVLLATHTTCAQDDIALHVGKVQVLRITPDSMYFNSHTARTFKIHDIPSGCKLKAEFSGGDLTIHDSTIILTPFYVYRDTDVSKLDSKYMTGYKSTKGNFFLAELTINAYDSTGKLRAQLTRKCQIKPERYPRNIQVTSKQYDQPMLEIYNSLIKDSTAKRIQAQ